MSAEQIDLLVVTEEPIGRRWFTAAYRVRNGLATIGTETTIRAHAEAVADDFRRQDDKGREYVVATRILPPWVPVQDAK